MAEFTMPSLGADMDEGILLEWLVQPGEQVHKGDVVAVVETSKSTIEVECFDTGTVQRLLIEPGTTVPVGTPLAVIGTGPQAIPHKAHAEAPSPAPSASGPSAAYATRPAPAALSTPGGPVPVTALGPLVRHLAADKGVALSAVQGTGPGGRITRTDVEHAAPAGRRIKASPLARRLAEELHVSLADVPGSGAHGVVRAADVRAAAEEGTVTASAMTPTVSDTAPAAAPTPARQAADRAAAMRHAIGGLMARSKREIPHYYLSTTIDLAAALEWMREHNRHSQVSERLVPAALLLKAAALAAGQVPELNGFWTDDRFVPGSGVHLGVAVSLRGGGLVAPALHHADTLALPELMIALKDLVARARAGRLRGSEATDPTITVTNLGDQGVESVFGVIYPPQVALVGFGRVVERPFAAGGLLGVRPVVTATLSADHRATDGAVGARYLTVVDRLLQNPEEL
jgi:pyruvate dehydrogenase E2 component (dihydrolipoamide acetyltransferase)